MVSTLISAFSSGLSLDLGLMVLALVSSLATGVWPCLTSLQTHSAAHLYSTYFDMLLWSAVQHDVQQAVR